MYFVNCSALFIDLHTNYLLKWRLNCDLDEIKIENGHVLDLFDRQFSKLFSRGVFFKEIIISGIPKQYSAFSFLRLRYTYGSMNNNGIYVNEKNNSARELG